MKHLYFEVVLIAALLLASLFLFSSHGPATLGSENRIENGMTNSSTTLSTSSATVVLQFNSGRQYARVSNDTAPPVYCSLSNTSATVSTGIRLEGIGNTTSSQPAFIEVGPSTQIDYVGVINCICGAGSCRVTTAEK
jgi:hypothetical protein